MKNEPVGTFECPICGHDRPHWHSDDAVKAYNNDQIRNDGWISAVLKGPAKTGYYLIRDFVTCDHLIWAFDDALKFRLSCVQVTVKGEPADRPWLNAVCDSWRPAEM
ncbi:MAG: hypothetical protein KGL39_04905 [Patescibacteria group bacterium]|nr:hypothetical protein [Patescibacteria group bacterium]